MLNTKSYYVIDKHNVKGNIHVVGVGATGSKIIESLVRLNLASKIIAYDMDKVEEKNLNNQAYLGEHIGLFKVDAIKDLALKIDPDVSIRTKIKEVNNLRTKNSDVVFIVTDNFQSRINILDSISGEPLIITGGVSSIGGNIEVVRGDKNVKKLLNSYKSIKHGNNPDPGELTPCGSPISIYHRIQTIASFMVDRFIIEVKNQDELYYNILMDIPNLIIIKDES